MINAISTAPTTVLEKKKEKRKKVNTDKCKEIYREKPHTFIGREVNYRANIKNIRKLKCINFYNRET